ncbi:MAG TPA: TolC family protein, partial [Firmicutes bacterium]|nr:TolC family protein [Bacillota bacterium]
PVDLLPNLEIPIVAVSTRYEGAGPQEVENLVTRPLEGAVGAVANVQRVRSVSQDGSSLVIAEFAWGTNVDLAVQDVRDKVDLAAPFLPSGTDKPLVVKADPSLMPVVRIAFASSADLPTLTRLAEDVVKPALERLEGVAMVSIEGGAEEEIQVLVDPNRLQGYGVSLPQVTQALRFENLNLPGGAVEEAGRRALVRCTAEFASLDDVGAVLVPARGGAVALRDVAEIRQGSREPHQLVRLNGHPSVMVSVQKQSGANTVQVSRAVRKALVELSRQLPPGVQLETVEDQAVFVEQSIGDTVNNAWQGAVLAALVLLVFLQSFAATGVIAVSMPVSIIATFLFMYAAHVGLNMMSLGGLALGVGMLVDNSIVVLESIFRHRSAGEPPLQAAVTGTSEVGAAITASTLTTLAVFLPILFVKGFAAELFRELGLTVSFALLMSLFVAMTVLPLAASRANLEPSAHPLAGRVRRQVDRLNTGYRRLLGWAVGHRKQVLGLALASVVVAGLLSPLVGSEFLPPMDLRQVRVSIEMPEGTPLARTDEVVARVEKSLLARGDVQRVLVSTGEAAGMGGMSSGGTANRGELVLRLKDHAPPTGRVVEQLRREVADIAGADIKVTMDSGMMGSEQIFGTPIAVELRGDDLQVLQGLAEEVARRVGQVPGTREVEVSTGRGVPELRVHVDRTRAAAYGLSAAQIGSMVKAAVEGEVATRYKVAGRELDVRVRFPEPYRRAPEDVEYLALVSPTAGAVPLRAVATLERAVGPVAVERDDQERVVSVTARVVGRTLGQVSTDVQRAVSAIDLPPGYTVDFGGETQQMTEAFGTLGWSLLLAIVLVYMVMAVQFESLSVPLVIMGTVPLAFVGVIIALVLARKTLSIPTLVGVITLVGIVVNNAIVLVDYTGQLRQRGMSRLEAVLEAGVVRLRPVLMTTTTTVLGLLPMALGLGKGSEIRSPIAVTLIGGLTFSTMLTLVVIPVLYLLMDDFLSWVARRRIRVARATGALVLCLALGFVVLTFPAPARAADDSLRFDLEEAVSYALAHNPQVRASESRMDMARYTMWEAQRTTALLQQPPPTSPQTYESAKMTQLVPLQAQIGHELALQAWKATQATITTAVKLAYFGCLQADAAVEAATAGLQAAEKQYEATSIKIAKGFAADKDLLSAESRREQARGSLATVERYRQLAFYGLCNLLGLPPDTDVRFEEEEFPYKAFTLTAEELAQKASRAEDRRYEVFSARKQVEIKEKEYDLTIDYPPDSPHPEMIALASLYAAQDDLKAAELRVRNEVYQAYQELQNAATAYEMAELSGKDAGEGLRLARVSYNLGAASRVDVEVAELMLAQAQANLRRSLYAWQAAREKFEHSYGYGFSLGSSSPTPATSMSGASSAYGASSASGSPGGAG